MGDHLWIRSENFIDTSTIDNHLLAKEIFNEFDLNLLSGIDDTDILEYYNFFHPFNVQYKQSFSIWDSLTSSSPANTLGVKQLIVKLRGVEIQKWDIQIQAFYPRESTDYVKLMPHYRKDFQQGSVDIRVNAVTNLVMAIGDDVNLASLKVVIQAFLDLLNTAILIQEKQFVSIDLASTELEVSRYAASEAIMYVYGKLVCKFYKNIKLIENYFPIELLQRITQVLYVATLKNNKPKNIFKRKMDIKTNTLQIKIVGENSVIGYFTNGIATTLKVNDLYLMFPPNSQDDYNPIDMGYTDDKRYFYLVKTGIGEQMVSVKIN